MNCEELQKNISLYLSGELNSEQAAAAEAHLHSCQSCTAAMSTDVALDHSLREAMLEHEPDASAVVNRVRSQMEQKSGFSQLFRVSQFSGRLAFRLAAITAVLVAALAVGYKIYFQPSGPNLARAAAYDHYQDVIVPKPAAWAYGNEQGAQFVQAHFPGRDSLISSITPSGGTLEKVRICNLRGTSYAHFVFQAGAAEVSVFLRIKESGDNEFQTASLHDQNRGLQVAEFSSPDFIGAVVGKEGDAATETTAAHAAKSL